MQAATVEDYLKEEVLYREALEMGLDRNDKIIPRRGGELIRAIEIRRPGPASPRL